MDEEKIFLIASFLLRYPDEEWFQAFEDVEEEVEKIGYKITAQHLFEFLDYVKGVKELDVEELYVNTFDFKRDRNLYLTYYKFKDQKERGMELINLKEMYREAGFQMIEGEIPDYLPLILEFTGISGHRDVLEGYSAEIESIYNTLSRDKNPYAYLLKSVLSALKEDDKGNIINKQLCNSAEYISMGGC